MKTAEQQYYNERWRQFSYANPYCQERCIFFLQALREIGIDQPRICDLGSGSGWLSGVLSCFGPTLGVELSPDAVELAKKRYPAAEFVCADATEWRPPAKSFDVVISQEVIEHIVDKAAYLKIAREAVKDGGYLLMTTPNLSTLNSVPKAEREAYWEIQPVELPVNRQQLNTLLSNAGFHVLATSSVVDGQGRLGIHRLVNSFKFRKALTAVGLEKSWRTLLMKRNFGMYMTTVARAV